MKIGFQIWPLRLTGLYRWLDGQVTLVFKERTFAWTAVAGPHGYQPTPYETTEEDGRVIFTVRAVREAGDSVDWRGVYDGVSLSNVTAVWTRTEKDFWHDLFLPATVTFSRPSRLRAARLAAGPGN